MEVIVSYHFPPRYHHRHHYCPSAIVLPAVAPCFVVCRSSWGPPCCLESTGVEEGRWGVSAAGVAAGAGGRGDNPHRSCKMERRKSKSRSKRPLGRSLDAAKPTHRNDRASERMDARMQKGSERMETERLVGNIYISNVLWRRGMRGVETNNAESKRIKKNSGKRNGVLLALFFLLLLSICRVGLLLNGS